jgi:hypothetical protein
MNLERAAAALGEEDALVAGILERAAADLQGEDKYLRRGPTVIGSLDDLRFVCEASCDLLEARVSDRRLLISALRMVDLPRDE